MKAPDCFRRTLRKTLNTVAGLALGLTIAACSVEEHTAMGSVRLNAPFNIEEIRARAGAPDEKRFICHNPPKALTNLHFESIYGNLTKNSSIIDPDAYEAYNEALAPVRTFEMGLTGMANRYVRSDPPRSDTAQCVLAWMKEWAEQDALLGSTNRTGEFVRKWTLGTIASAWLEIRDETALDEDDRRVVEKWIHDVAVAVQRDFSRDKDDRSRQNNHLYWAAWGVASAAMALDDRPMFSWAMEKAEYGIRHIRKDGTLPLEMDRGRKAFNYHVYAATPLFMLAEAGLANGVDLYNENDRALNRLGRRILRSADDPQYFVQKTGEPQDLTRTLTPANLVWLEVYNARFPSREGRELLKKFRPMRQSRVGGDATLLYGLGD